MFSGVKLSMGSFILFLSAIKDFPTPTNITGARSWFGLVNQVAWVYSFSPIMRPFRELVKANSKFTWDDNLDKIFNDSKAKKVSLVEEGIRTFDTSRRTCLQTDWSKDGIGYLLLQQYCECDPKMPLFVAQMVGDLCTLDLVSQHLLKQDILPQKVNH